MTLSGMKKHHKSTKPESHQMVKMFSSFSFFRWASSNCMTFTMGFCTKQQHFTPSSAPACHNFKV